MKSRNGTIGNEEDLGRTLALELGADGEIVRRKQGPVGAVKSRAFREYYEKHYKDKLAKGKTR